MGVRDLLFVGVVVGGSVALGAGLWRAKGGGRGGAEIPVSPREDFKTAVAEVDSAIRRGCAEKGLKPAPRASDLAVLRRMSLALTGSIPSLEEVRRFESIAPEGRVDSWLEILLKDRRTADSLAERFARAFVGTEDGPFILFRRRRFASWLGDAFHQNRPYDAIVREMIAGEGVWTDHPATNFVSVTFSQETKLPDPERLAARTSRAFLGVRLDCAQCHDHPFQPWTQADFRGLAAYFGTVQATLRGIHGGENFYRPADRKTKAPVEVAARVPFHPELVPDSGDPRTRLARWVTDPGNPNFARATANRVWALMLGRPLVDPVDDLPASGDVPEALDLLAKDFSAHGHDLRRLIRLIASTEAFRRDSADESSEPSEESEAAWAVFPMTRLRPDQVAASLFQSGTVATIDSRSFWLARLAVFTGQNDFVRRYGDTGEDEFDGGSGTIPQRLLLMNGQLVGEKIKDELFNASSLIAGLSPDDSKAIDAAYLTVLTRRPSPEELAYFAARVAGTKGKERKDRLTDLFWTLINSSEFSWNH